MMQELLEKGRKIIADREAAQDREREEQRERMCAIWETARAVALKVFAPLGAEIPVQPCVAPEGWDPDRDKHNNVSFYVRPWKDSGCIVVRLHGSSYATWGSEARREPSGWTWKLEDPKAIFQVESRFHADKEYHGENDDEVFVHAHSHLPTNDLAEALALCERHAEVYRIVKADEEARWARVKDRKAPPAPKTKAETLVEALREFIQAEIPNKE